MSKRRKSPEESRAKRKNARLEAGATPGPLHPAAQPSAGHPALSVTRGVVVSKSGNCVIPASPVLACGIDSLDLGFHVDWGENWFFLRNELESAKEAATGTDGILWRVFDGEGSLILPGGRAPCYRFHLKLPYAHVWIAKSQKARGNSNLFVSFESKTLRTDGVEKAVEKVRRLIAALDGRVESITVNRCDLAADTLIPGGLPLDLLLDSTVSRATKREMHIGTDGLETFYIGSKSAPLRARLYDKGKEMLQGNGKSVFLLGLWDLDSPQDVWRVEFQMRRIFLREMKILHFHELMNSLGELWDYATRTWTTLRLSDNPNPSRRTLHPWWEGLQDCKSMFGGIVKVRRSLKAEMKFSAGKSKQQILGHLVSFGAYRNVTDFHEAVDLFLLEVEGDLTRQEFGAKVLKRRIQNGFEKADAYGRWEGSGEYPPDWDSV